MRRGGHYEQASVHVSVFCMSACFCMSARFASILRILGIATAAAGSKPDPHKNKETGCRCSGFDSVTWPLAVGKGEDFTAMSAMVSQRSRWLLRQLHGGGTI